MKKSLAILAVLSAAVLAACGGGGGGGINVGLPPPGYFACGDGSFVDAQSKCEFRTEEYGRNYALAKINAASAYELGYFGQGVTVLVHEPSGVRITHEDLADNVITAPLPEDNDFFSHRFTPGNHGTWVAGIIVAAQNGKGSHGVAPSAKFIPTPSNISGDQNIDYLNEFHVRNQSYTTVPSRMLGYINGVRYHSGFYPRFVDVSRVTTRVFGGTTVTSLHAVGAHFATASLKDSEIVRVFAAENTGLQSRNTRIFLRECANQERRLVCGDDESSREISVTIDEMINSFEDESHGFWSTLNITAVYPRNDADYPVHQPSLEDNWLVVAALDQNDKIADFSNACLDAKRWCVAAHGVSIYAPSGFTDDGYVNWIEGTSFAAPMVSGALAVLKSARPELPMNIIRAVLLTTATDLGDPGIDELYGWGLPNLEKGINHILTVQTPAIGPMSAVPLRSLRHEFPAEFSRLRGISGLTVAVEITDGAYYNMPLADIIPPQQNKINFGNAAKELLNDNAQNQPNGFAVFGDSDNGFGLRWHNSLSGGGVHAELSYLPKTAGIVGAETAAKIGLRRPLFGGFAFGEYGGGFARTQTGGGYVLAAEDISTEEWTAGAEVLDVLRAGDKLRFSVRSAKRIRGGKVAVSLPVASGDFYQSFLGEEMQELSLSRKEVSLSEAAPLIYSAGYSVRGGKTEWAMAAELSAGEGKLSAKWRVEF